VSTQGSIKIKNVSGAAYTIVELGGIVVIPDQEIIDLLDPLLPQYYADWEDANRLVTVLTTAKLYQDIKDGHVIVTENVPPE